MGIYKKFKSIKLTIIEGRKLKPFAVAKVLQDHEDRIAALESESSSDEGDTTTYGFTSYADAEGTTEWGEGTVKGTGITKGNYAEAEVLTNSPDASFIGQKFFIRSTAKADGTTIYKVYKDAGRTAAGFWIKLSEI